MMGAMGRKGDTMIAHLTPGDVVIPRDIIFENPDFLTKFKKAMDDNRSDYRTHIAGSGYENFNPETGAPEFGWLKNLTNPITKGFKAVKSGLSRGNMGDVIIGAAGAGGTISPKLDQMIGGWIGASPEGMGLKTQQNIDPGSNLGDVEQPFTPKRPDEGTRPYDLFNRDVGGQMFGSLDPMQQRSYLATQGSQGGGIGDEDKSYYMNLLQRNLIDEGGQLGNMNEALLPVERNYLSRMGLPTDNTLDFFQALQS